MKTRRNLTTLVALAIVLSLFSACVLLARGDEGASKTKDPLAELEKAKQRLAPTYKLGYRFQKDDVFRTKVVHLATVENKIKGTSQTTRTRTVSTRVWRIQEVDAAGNITFDNIVERLEMWNHVEGRAQVHYDSESGEQPPQDFAMPAASVGKVLATIKINPQGRIITRTNNQAQFNPGIGDITVPFPPPEQQPLKAGTTWSIPDELRMATADGTIKKIQTQQQYRLVKVEAGVATIAVQTQILTPVNDPKLQSQLVQKLQKGTIEFDVDAGRLIRKQMDIDEQVFGFNGPDSHMQYAARFTEEPLKENERTARKDEAAGTKQ